MDLLAEQTRAMQPCDVFPAENKIMFTANPTRSCTTMTIFHEIKTEIDHQVLPAEDLKWLMAPHAIPITSSTPLKPAMI
jgi:hypothetical protein